MNKDKELKLRISDEDIKRLSFCQNQLNISKSAVVRIALKRLEKELNKDLNKHCPKGAGIYIESIEREDIGYKDTQIWIGEELRDAISKDVIQPNTGPERELVINQIIDKINAGIEITFDGKFKSKYKKLTAIELESVISLIAPLKENLRNITMESVNRAVATAVNKKGNKMNRKMYVEENYNSDNEKSLLAWPEDILEELLMNKSEHKNEKDQETEAKKIIASINEGNEYTLIEKGCDGKSYESKFRVATEEDLKIAKEQEDKFNTEIDQISMEDIIRIAKQNSKK